MTTAQQIGLRKRASGRKHSKDSVVTIVLDDHNVHCLTESDLDTWWAVLKPEDKGALYDLFMEGALDRGRAAAAGARLHHQLRAEAGCDEAGAGERHEGARSHRVARGPGRRAAVRHSSRRRRRVMQPLSRWERITLAFLWVLFFVVGTAFLAAYEPPSTKL